MKREPVETMSRMPLMQECHHWRTRGPALEAVARAADECLSNAASFTFQHEEFAKVSRHIWAVLVKRMARLARVSQRERRTGK